MKKKFTTTLDPELIRQLKIKAAEKETTVSTILSNLITEYLDAEIKTK